MSEEGRPHDSMSAGVTQANEGIDGISLEHPRPDLRAEAGVRAFVVLARDLPTEPSCRRISTRPRTNSSTSSRAASTCCSTARSLRRAGRPDPPAEGHPARHLQQDRAHDQMPVLGVADAPALRSVLGAPQSRADGQSRRCRRDLGRARGRFPAAAGGLTMTDPQHHSAPSIEESGHEGHHRRRRHRRADHGADAARRGIKDRGLRAVDREVREVGVGINTLPHAIRELAELGLLPALDAVGVRTRELHLPQPPGPGGLARTARHPCRPSRAAILDPSRPSAEA